MDKEDLTKYKVVVMGVKEKCFVCKRKIREGDKSLAEITSAGTIYFCKYCGLGRLSYLHIRTKKAMDFLLDE